MTKEQEVFEKVNRIRIDFFDSKYKDVHTDDELEEKYEALGDVLSMLKEKDKEIEKKDKQIDLMANYIVDLIKYNNPEEKREVEEIKQYFERKSKK